MKHVCKVSAVSVFAALLFVSAAASAVAFRFPIADPGKMMFDYVVYADHDPADGAMQFDCLAFDGRVDFPYCYDAHDGSDYMLIDGFMAMDEDSAEIVAAASGTVIAIEDGNYDRCHADMLTQEINCDGHPMRGNYVKLLHEGGYQTWYWHMKTGSVNVVVDQQVSCGDVLGLVGSSGNSSNPHLHFEVRVPTDEAGGTTWIDPYAGPESQPESLWVLQQDPTTLLPGAYCEGDEIPDFSDNDEDTGAVAEDVYDGDAAIGQDVSGEVVWVDGWGDAVYLDGGDYGSGDAVVALDGFGFDLISTDAVRDGNISPDAGEVSNLTDAAVGADEGASDPAGNSGCSAASFGSAGSRPSAASASPLMLLLLCSGVILAARLYRRRPSHLKSGGVRP
jgi:hypothetical protein